MSLAKLKVLINLARIDREVVDKEKKYIINIGAANGVQENEVLALLQKDHEMIIPTGLSDDQRFEYIFDVVQLMKIDERLYQEEIRFCSKVASKLGYSQEVIFDLMLHVRAVMEANELEALKVLTTKYLSKP